MATLRTTSSRHIPTSIFAIMRTGVGITSILVPTQAAAFFGIDTVEGSKIMFRLFGAREVMLGVLLWRLQTGSLKAFLSNGSNGQAHQYFKAILQIGFVIDTMDLISSIVCIAEGNLGGKAIWLVAGGAVGFAALGGAGLLALK